jgi:hypothetical protein
LDRHHYNRHHYNRHHEFGLPTRGPPDGDGGDGPHGISPLIGKSFRNAFFPKTFLVSEKNPETPVTTVTTPRIRLTYALYEMLVPSPYTVTG